MKLSTLTLVMWVVTAALVGSSGANTLSLPDGRDWRISEWSSERVLDIPGDDISREVHRREANAMAGTPDAGPRAWTAYRLAALLDEAGTVLWIGPAESEHFSFRDRIYGVHMSNNLRVIPGIAGEAAPLEDVVGRVPEVFHRDERITAAAEIVLRGIVHDDGELVLRALSTRTGLRPTCGPACVHSVG